MNVAFDESKGTGKGYDQLVADLNENGDLTDDPKVSKAGGGPRAAGPDFEQANYGPIELPANRATGQWRPRFFAEIYLYNKAMLKMGSTDANIPIGQVRVFAGNTLETQVDINGVRQLFGVVDGNCNFRLGDPASSIQVNRGTGRGPSWYLMPGDYFLRDRDGSGKFERSVGRSEAEVLSSLVYFGTKPFSFALDPALKSVRFEPFTEPLGEWSLRREVQELVLGRQVKPDQWEALTPGITDGKVLLPEGKYRIFTCALGAKNSAGRWYRTQSSDVPDRVLEASQEQPAGVLIGPPLALEGTAESPRPARDWELTDTERSRRSKPTIVAFNVVIAGAAGERYNGFVEEGKDEPVPPPSFEVLDPEGKVVASGKFEYG
jgi:hypothetical protein